MTEQELLKIVKKIGEVEGKKELEAYWNSLPASVKENRKIHALILKRQLQCK